MNLFLFILRKDCIADCKVNKVHWIGLGIIETLESARSALICYNLRIDNCCMFLIGTSNPSIYVYIDS